MHVLMVDDTKTILLLGQMMLQAERYEMSTALNGREALEVVKKKRPDVIVLDVMMPEMDGIETCRRLKSDPATKDIPVMMLTTKGENDMVEKAFAAGCDDYATKPFTKLELVGKIKALLAKKKTPG